MFCLGSEIRLSAATGEQQKEFTAERFSSTILITLRSPQGKRCEGSQAIVGQAACPKCL